MILEIVWPTIGWRNFVAAKLSSIHDSMNFMYLSFRLRCSAEVDLVCCLGKCQLAEQNSKIH